MNIRRRFATGQTLAELGIMMPFLCLLLFGVIEFGWVLFQSNAIRGYAREASNLISRNRSLEDAEKAIVAASNAGGPVKIGADESDSRMILSVVTLGTSGANQNEAIVVQRHSIGNLTANSVLGEQSQGAYGPPPGYDAESRNNPSIRVSGPLPNGYVLTPGQSLFVTEIFTRRGTIADFAPLVFPDILYASAFF
jgi:hypothetical protein